MYYSHIVNGKVISFNKHVSAFYRDSIFRIGIIDINQGFAFTKFVRWTSFIVVDKCNSSIIFKIIYDIKPFPEFFVIHVKETLCHDFNSLKIFVDLIFVKNNYSCPSTHNCK